MATGKISRLPRDIREQLNRRLDDGEPGNRLVNWLNELPAVQALLAEEFGGAAINEQNLTNWKQGGFREWRMQQEIASLGVINAERRSPHGNAEEKETFNAQHSTLNVQGDGKFVEQPPEANRQLRPTEEQPTITVEQLVTVLAIRYLAAVREWQLSPVPPERRWRRLRVMLRDVMKLRRGELEGQRLELDRERLEFARELLETGKLPDEREAMVALLGAGRHWPEVGEELVGAFRLLRERKRAEMEGNKAEFGSIKVNQGDKNLKNEKAQTEFVDRPPSSCRDDARRSRLRQGFRLRQGYGGQAGGQAELAGQRPALPVVVARMDVYLAEINQIKVDQGDIFFPGWERMRAGTRTRNIYSRHGMARHPPAPPLSFIRDGPCPSVVGRFPPAI